MPTPLFPVPRSYREHSGVGAEKVGAEEVGAENVGAGESAPVIVSLDETLPAQGYRIRTTPEAISLGHRDAAGLRYGLQTLDQLRASGTLRRTAVEIVDWPDFETRGFMLDVSRDRVPTRRTLARYVELLSLARINQLELYMEHTFTYADHDAVWSRASALTAEDMRWLDDLCAGVGIALVANQNTFGHMERWLRHERYSARAEKPGGFELFGRHREAGTLEPTRENLDLVGELLVELTSTLRSRRVNIGADEPFELGLGRSSGEVERRGGGAVYFDYVSEVMRPLLDDGFEVEFWADIFGDYPELMGSVPAGAIPVVWQYDSPSVSRAVWGIATPRERADWDSVPLDVEALGRGFSARAAAMIEAGTPFWVAPGTSTWQSFVGRIDNALENMVDAAEVGIANGSTGYINTLWGDHGHFDPPAVSFGPVVFGGAVSWCLDSNRGIDLAAVLDRRVFDDEESVIGGVLMRIGETALALGAPMLNASPLFLALLRGGDIAELPAILPEALEAVDATFVAELAELDFARPASADGDIAVRELRLAIRFARLGVEVIRRGGVDRMAPAEARRLLSLLESLLVEQRECWLLRSRPGGVDDSLEYLADLRSALTVQARRG
ncbi:glycoside hydrolase family 20 zincin-like fold domain-containing protein [Lacisediminihabitans sp.]|uniref:glycoside hydrolase family 20 zincin-like fold domain-containing protein n=1 Tax=Lacisediminihabitans sp. TaxID=2787631 RepID=UPI00374DC512